MKITYFLSSFPSLSETFVINQIAGLIDLGHEVRILSLRKGKENESIHDKIYTYDMLNHQTVLVPDRCFLKNKFIKYFLFCFLFLFNIWRKGVLKILVDKNIRVSERFLLCMVIIYNKSIVSDIFISHFGPVGVYADRLRMANFFKGPQITFFHGFDISKKSLLTEYSSAYQELFKNNEKILTISEFWKKKLIAMGCNEDKIFINHMGIDCSKFTIPVSIGHTKKGLQILSVCRLVEKKGITYALKAVKLVSDKNIPIEYRIIGDGIQKKDLESEIKDLDLGDRVFLMGAKKQEDVQDMMKQADIFLLPSITARSGDMEGIPVSLMEAMAMGVIVISSFHSGIPELVSDKFSGFLVEEKDFKGIASYIEDIYKNKYDLLSIRKNARDKIEKDFNQLIIYKELSSLCTSFI